MELAESTLKAQEDFIASSQAINDLRGEIKDIAFKIDSAIRELSSKVEKSMGATKYSIGFLMATLATIIALVIRNFLGK
ncbi:MAG: hypothetical protein LBT38_08175 [Deltaproteobacteria bacterium]|nr:hypothetical protein [Deltaproteobacteria bacterium]